MKKRIWIVWQSKDNEENLGCWYDDMKIKVFDTRNAADDYLAKKTNEEGVYCGIVNREIMF